MDLAIRQIWQQAITSGSQQANIFYSTANVSKHFILTKFLARETFNINIPPFFSSESLDYTDCSWIYVSSFLHYVCLITCTCNWTMHWWLLLTFNCNWKCMVSRVARIYLAFCRGYNVPTFFNLQKWSWTCKELGNLYVPTMV